MGTQFIRDTRLEAKRKTVAQILQRANKKPYPNKETIHLARFLDACFAVVEEKKKKEREKVEEQRRKRIENLQATQRRKQEAARLAELEVQAPEPPANESQLPPPINLEDTPLPKDIPSPKQEKKEYVIPLYGSPVGIYIDQEKEGKYLYHSIEPRINQELLTQAKRIAEKDLQKDNSLFDNNSFLEKVGKKAGKKTKQEFNAMLLPTLKYYLERDILGSGKLDPLIHDPKVEEIVVDGPQKTIRISYKNLGEIKTNIILEKKEEIDHILNRVAQATGKNLKENPLLNETFQGLHFEGIQGIGEQQSTIKIRRVENDL